MDELYGHRCGVCGGFTNSAEHSVTFSPEALVRGLKDIYYGLDVKHDIQEDIFLETLRIFNLAAAKGISEGKDEKVITDEFLEQLRHNNEVFAAFRTHRMQNDIATQLVSTDGVLKSFEQFSRDVAPLTGKYCRQWLETEYNTAVIRAHRAADWKHFESEKDIYPNLRWMPTTSAKPDPVHERFWSQKLTLPVDDPFWGKHHPGERWGCKCTCEQTDEPVNDLGERDAGQDTASKGLHGNPAQTGKIFSDDHPYIADAHPGAKEAVADMDYIVNGRPQIKALDGTSYELTKNVVKAEEEIRVNKKFETGVVFDKNGKVLVDKRGEATSVRFTNDEITKMKDAVLTHNHPRGWRFGEKELGRIGSSFSREDILLAIHSDMAEVRAVTPNYTFSLKRPQKGWGIDEDGFLRQYEAFDDSLDKECRRLIKDGIISVNQINAAYYHLLNKQLSKKFGWSYEKKRTK